MTSEERKGRGNAITGLTCGITGLVFAFVVPWIGFPVSVAGIITSTLGLKSEETKAKVGLGLSIGGVIVSLGWFLLILALAGV